MRSVATRFLLPVGLITVLFSTFVIYRTYTISQRHLAEVIDQQAALALEFDLAIRKYVAEEIRPRAEEMLPGSEFIPETMSTSFVARSVFETVKKQFPDYIIKFSSDDPRNPANRASADELRMIDYFNSNPLVDKWSGRISMNGRPYYARFAARRMRESCLRCHGVPDDAPESLRERYGAAAGFNRPVGQVVALDTVAIPVGEAAAGLTSRLARQSAILIGGLVVLFAGIAFSFRSIVGSRLTAISKHFKETAARNCGDDLTLLEVKGVDEISELASSYNILAEKLHSAHALLEQRVQERTSELETANRKLQQQMAERARIERVVRDSEDLYRTIFENTGTAAMIIEEDTTISLVNTGCEELSGLKREEIENKLSWTQFVCPEDREVMIDRHRKRRSDDPSVPSTYEFGWINNDGERREVAVTVAMIPGKQTSIASIIDITERKHYERDLRKAKEFAEAATRAKSEFLANMSHEIRTPMTAVMGFADVLLESRDDNSSNSGTIEAARAIRDNGEYLLGIINDILDLSKIEAGKLAIDKHQCSPCQIIANVSSLMRVRADVKNLSFTVRYTTPIPELINSDERRIRQILINVIGNAIKFTEHGEVELVVSFRNDGSPCLCFDVVDTGLGMTLEQASRLFQPFTQADASTTRRFGGTGLGLAISQRLAQMLGGDVTVLRTVAGEGTTFQITVAAEMAEGAKLLDDPGAATIVHQEQSKSRPAASTTSLDGISILLAEDNPTNQAVIAGLLSRMGARVETVDNGLEATNRALSAASMNQPYDVVLMDMQMPVMDGYEATASLRDAGYARPIVALTAHAMSGDKDKCLAAGCDGYATKPVNRNVLAETIRGVCRRCPEAMAAFVPE